jgi:hypothetical protein
LYQTDVLFHKSPQILCSKDPKDVATSNNFKKFINSQERYTNLLHRDH